MRFELCGLHCIRGKDGGEQNNTSNEEDGSSQDDENPSSNEDSERDNDMVQTPNMKSVRKYLYIYPFIYTPTCMHDYLHVHVYCNTQSEKQENDKPDDLMTVIEQKYK